jgi:hypothetical protein
MLQFRISRQRIALSLIFVLATVVGTELVNPVPAHAAVSCSGRVTGFNFDIGSDLLEATGYAFCTQSVFVLRPHVRIYRMDTSPPQTVASNSRRCSPAVRCPPSGSMYTAGLPVPNRCVWYEARVGGYYTPHGFPETIQYPILVARSAQIRVCA